MSDLLAMVSLEQWLAECSDRELWAVGEVVDRLLDLRMLLASEEVS